MRRLFVIVALLLAGWCASPASAQIYYNGGQLAVTTDLGADYTVATLPTCDNTIARRTAWVTDLMGLPNGDRAICDGGAWKPIRPLAVQSVATSNMTVRALVNAPTIIVTGTIGVGVTNTLSLSTQYAYTGARQCVARKATGVGAFLAATISLAINAWTCFEFDGTTWVQTQSGGLL